MLVVDVVIGIGIAIGVVVYPPRYTEIAELGDPGEIDEDVLRR